jgi:S-adenosylmethionine decarboxylase
MSRQRAAGCSHTVDLDNAAAEKSWPQYIDVSPGDAAKDHFINKNDRVFAGTHLILDFWGARELDNPRLMERTLKRCVQDAGATLLHIHLHRFSPGGGLSGVAVLAESHISVHTWPEKSFAAFDIFMCGDTCPEKAVDALKQAFRPVSVSMVEHLRGVIHDG